MGGRQAGKRKSYAEDEESLSDASFSASEESEEDVASEEKDSEDEDSPDEEHDVENATNLQPAARPKANEGKEPATKKQKGEKDPAEIATKPKLAPTPAPAAPPAPQKANPASATMPPAAPPLQPSAKKSAAKAPSNEPMTRPSAPLPTSVQEAVLLYVNEWNAPLNAQMVADQFKGSLTKAQAETHLADLLDGGKVRMTEFGKVKAYYPELKDFGPPSAAEMAECDALLSTAKAEQQQLARQIAELQNELKSNSTKLTLPEARKEAATLQAELDREQASLDNLRKAGDGEALTKAEEEKVRRDYKRLLKVYKTRRSKCLEITDKICEFSNKPRKKLFDEWGLERDEEYGVVHTTFPALA
ncbi:hypothetical protein AB1Y20_001479 [Prymnesium parvum]|uniref:Homologous-pairing protein 2 winged helix domain-containing protein n=1 Tax=Prymnesium parvum TaxID=97485 RepID=A0AB34K7V1_PRYPA